LCGIVGSTSKKIYRTDLNEMSARGPDSRGIFTDDDVTLGHTRLSIIDTSDGSRQPLESDKCVLVFNGEIYNYRELGRDYLHGEQSSDTLVLFYLLQTKGVEETLKLLNGMFAFCYYDKIEKKLWLARDRFGKKPLFYMSEGTTLTFASSLDLVKQMHREESFKIDEGILSFYFSAFYVPSPRTIYERIKSLMPGTSMSFDLKTGVTKTTTYWHPSVRERARKTVEEFLDVFRDSVKIRLRSDVPLGAFLSGGIDSTLVVKVMSEISDSHVKTYTACVKDELNEETYAETVSNKYGTAHTTRNVEKSDLKIRDIRRLVKFFGQPFADSSIVPTERVCDLISRDVTVAVSGDGADELFMGYDKYKSTSKTFSQRVFRNSDLQFLKRRYRTDPENIVREIVPDFDRLSEIDRVNQFDVRIFLEGDILQKIDRLAMSKSLEVRSPFLDYRVAEYALSSDISQLLGAECREGKHILKKIVEEEFGTSFAFRKKTGFMLNLSEWRQQILSVLKAMRDVYLGSGFFECSVQFEALDTYTLFGILNFLVWFEELR